VFGDVCVGSGGEVALGAYVSEMEPSGNVGSIDRRMWGWWERIVLVVGGRGRLNAREEKIGRWHRCCWLSAISQHLEVQRV
jgi:hypothetical protein